ncbi:MAG: hypothetical protein GTN67_06160 [Hydrotalea flava]|uniref:anti-sigma factor family protein n=1 Tax=Hydrotalea lipotrueae TaxID=2803817 RepID=UPI0016B209EA|nr:hypothetical protein [Hydrotalea lipotrueae]MBY0347525.1 hypothetical protein [Hydrotalea flava]NIM35019.1 hypothetical protein [Hydrotalea flava]NIM37845.1 hypothetical protein [Hydrotalea flava]NIN03014.1 hypothetical protein [Hydrotalea flava]NIN14699.1 hypothetical protein [Hydrotalea flava]
MMKINRNNIESWLMRYVDGELSAIERLAVENYLVLNSDLAAELKALQQAKLPPEAVLYPYKTALLKRLKTHFEEAELLNFIDGESDSHTAAVIQEAMLDDAALAEQIVVLQAAKLPDEKIVFADKAALYRHEKKPVVVLWQRMMAAAVLLAVGILLWQIAPPVQQKKLEQVKETVALQNNIPNDAARVKTETLPLEAANSNAKALQQNTAKLAAVKEKAVTPKTKALQTITHNPATEKVTTLAVDQHSLQPINGGTITAPANTIAISATKITDQAVPANAIAAKAPENVMEKNTTVVAQPVVYRLLETDNDNNGSVYINNILINKNKVNGILQKAGGLLHTLRSQETGVQEKLTATAKLR